MTDLLSPWTIRGHTAPNRVVFGPHVTNLANGRQFSERHVAYYRRRAEGGAGMIVLEEAAIGHDWPYERSPAAQDATDGWASIVTGCADTNTLLLAALGHTGLQGSSAYAQRALLAPSAVPDPVSREMPSVASGEELTLLTMQFADAARNAVSSGCAGVELNFGQFSLVRQFLSGLTNHRQDEFGPDGPHGRATFAIRIVRAVRDAIGEQSILNVRICVDELAPWAGITPDDAPDLLDQLHIGVDAFIPVRGSIYSRNATSPDGHIESGFLRDIVAELATRANGKYQMIWQGSNIEVADVEAGLVEQIADAVEMTRAQIADPDLVAKYTAGSVDRIRPCTLCNQRCQVRDNRNPRISCQVNPQAGFEQSDSDLERGERASRQQRITIIGGGPAGTEFARLAAMRGHHVELHEASGAVGGSMTAMENTPGFERIRSFLNWQARELRTLNVSIDCNSSWTANDVADAIQDPEIDRVVIATGGITGPSIPGPLLTVDAATALHDPESIALRATRTGLPIVIWDALGGPSGVGIAEVLAPACSVILVHPDPVAGSHLALSGDLAAASTRLLQLGVTLQPRVRITHTTETAVFGVHHMTHETFAVEACALVVVTARLPNTLGVEHTAVLRIGDCVAPRNVGDALHDAHVAIRQLESST